MRRNICIVLLGVALALLLAACGGDGKNGSAPTPTAVIEPDTEPAATVSATPAAPSPTEAPVPNGDIVILFTSDVHCGIDRGFGYAGLAQIRDELEGQGYTTILVDDGDAIQGETIGTLTKGEAILSLMNDLEYDLALPGNHEFDYGMDRFLELTKKANFKYICCNFKKNGELVFEPYVVLEVAGKKVAFVGVTTPTTITSSTPEYFQNEKGEYIYSFCADDSGEALYKAVQDAVDSARGEGAEYVYVMGHCGDEAACSPWTYAEIIANTSGIDVFFDGHSHDMERVVMKNRDGREVIRVACGTELEGIGYSFLTAKDGISDTGCWTWKNEMSAPELLGIRNKLDRLVKETLEEVSAQLSKVVAHSAVKLTIYDPVAVTDDGNPIRMVRRAETNIGDFCADAIRSISGADVAIMNGGGIRKNLPQGDITYGDIINVFPFGNQLCVLDVTGQQILDALEWSARFAPDEFGGFLQVSGMTLEIDVSVPTPCKAGENDVCIGIEGKRRVSNVMIGGKPLDPAAHYTLAGMNYTIIKRGDGYTAFDGCKVLQDCVKLDNQLLIDYIVDTLGGEIGEEYADPCGQGRIVFAGEE